MRASNKTIDIENVYALWTVYDLQFRVSDLWLRTGYLQSARSVRSDLKNLNVQCVESSDWNSSRRWWSRSICVERVIFVLVWLKNNSKQKWPFTKAWYESICVSKESTILVTHATDGQRQYGQLESNTLKAKGSIKCVDVIFIGLFSSETVYGRKNPEWGYHSCPFDRIGQSKGLRSNWNNW